MAKKKKSKKQGKSNPKSKPISQLTGGSKSSGRITSSKNLNRAQRRAQEKLRNIQFQNQQIQTSTAVNFNRLNDLKDSFQSEVDIANLKISQLMLHGYWSMALERLFSSGIQEFDISSISNERQLRAYMTLVRGFNNDSGSTIEGARFETAMLSASPYINSFGSQWEDKVNNKRVNFDTSTISLDSARQAFANYRKIEEEFGPLIQMKGSGTPMDSDKLIALIYDSVIQGRDMSDIHQMLSDWQKQYSQYVSGTDQFASGPFRYERRR